MTLSPARDRATRVTRRLLVSTFAVVSIGLVACSGSESSVGGGASAEAACDEATKVLCEKIEQCAPFILRFGFGDAATCASRYRLGCITSMSAPGTSATPARLEQCAADVRAATCEDVLGRTPPASCRTEPGAQPDGAVCGTDAQCQGRLCRHASNGTCGACSTLGVAGTACERDDDCDAGLKCARKKCVAFGRAGASCSVSQPCLPTLACAEGTCSPPLEAGAPCTPPADFENNPCNFAKGVYCHPTSKVCTALGTATAGGKCGLTTEEVTVCIAGGECKTAACQAPAADGAPCNDTTGPKCLAPARCIGGVCTLSDPAACR